MTQFPKMGYASSGQLLPRAGVISWPIPPYTSSMIYWSIWRGWSCIPKASESLWRRQQLDIQEEVGPASTVVGNQRPWTRPTALCNEHLQVKTMTDKGVSRVFLHITLQLPQGDWSFFSFFFLLHFIFILLRGARAEGRYKRMGNEWAQGAWCERQRINNMNV